MKINFFGEIMNKVIFSVEELDEMDCNDLLDFSINDEKIKISGLTNHPSRIGGYCSGGCQLSYKVDKEKQCKYELKAFDYFIDKLLIEKIKKLEVINNYYE